MILQLDIYYILISCMVFALSAWDMIRKEKEPILKALLYAFVIMCIWPGLIIRKYITGRY